MDKGCVYGYRNANGLDINYSDEPFITKDSVVIGSEEVAPKNIPEQKDLAKLAKDIEMALKDNK